MKKWWAVWIASLGFLLGAWSFYEYATRPVEIIKWAPPQQYDMEPMEPARPSIYPPAVLRVASPTHDCRIKKIDLKATKRLTGEGTVWTVRALFIAYDGAYLSQALCPDQVGPTWGFNIEIDQERQLYFVSPYQVELYYLEPWTILDVQIATVQAPEGEFWARKRWCVECL